MSSGKAIGSVGMGEEVLRPKRGKWALRVRRSMRLEWTLSKP